MRIAGPVDPGLAASLDRGPVASRRDRPDRLAVPVRFDVNAPAPPRSRNFGPDAKPQRGPNAKAKRKDAERPRGPIPMKVTGRSFTLEDTAELEDDKLAADVDNFATSRPQEDVDKDVDKDKDDDAGE